MGEDAHADTCIAHQRAQTGGVQTVQPIPNILAIGHEPRLGSCRICKQTVLYRQRRNCPCDLAHACCLVGNGHAAGEGNCLLEASGKQRAGQHCHYVTTAGRETGNGDVVRIAAKLCNVILDPVQCLGDVQQGEVAGVIAAPAEGRQAVEAEQTQPVIQRDKNAVIPNHQLAAQNFLGVAGLVVAAVDKHQHRQLMSVGGGINIQLQAVLGADGTGTVLIGDLTGSSAIFGFRPHGRILRCLPAQLSHRGCTIGNAVPHKALALIQTHDRSVLGGAARGDLCPQAVFLFCGGCHCGNAEGRHCCCDGSCFHEIATADINVTSAHTISPFCIYLLL